MNTLVIILFVMLSECFIFVRNLDEQTCMTQSKFEYCTSEKSSANLMWNLYAGHNLYFRIISPGRCLSLGFKYSWKLKLLSSGTVVKKFPNFTAKAVLTIRKGILLCNEYNLEVTMKGTRQSKTLNCWFKINTAGPIPIIASGRLRNAISGDTVLLNGTKTDEAGVQVLQYRWKCSSTTSYAFCEDFYSTKTETTININGNPGDIFNITLTVFAKNILESTYQLIEVTKESYPVIHISCEKNCRGKGPFESDPTISVFLKASCTRNCQQISFLWFISNDIDEDDTLFGFTHPKLVIDENVLKYDTVYNVEVQAIVDDTPISSKAVWELKTTSEPEKNCSVSPSEGVNIKTLFQIKCSGAAHRRPLSYSIEQLYIRPENGRIGGIYLTQNMIPLLSVLLAPEAEILESVISVYDDKLITTDVFVQIYVEPLFLNVDSREHVEGILKVYNGQSKYTPSVRSLAKHGWADRAIQLMNCLMFEATHITSEAVKEEFYERLKYKVLFDLLMIPTNNAVKGSITMIPKLIGERKPKEVQFAVMLSKLCCKLSKNVESYMINTKYPMLEAHMINAYTTHLIHCSEFLLDGDYVQETGYNVSVGLPMEIHQVIEEDYPNYKDIIDGQARSQYVDITNEGINILRYCTHAFSMGLAYGEGRYVIGTTTKIIMDLDTAQDLEREFVSDPGVEIRLPKSLGFKKNEKIRMLFLSFDNNIYFWDENSKHISTRIIDLVFYNEQNKLISRIPQYIDAYLDIMNTTIGEEVFDGKVVVPDDNSEWSEKDIVVYRVDVKLHSMLLVEIDDIRSESIQVVLTTRRRPELKDFINATVLKDSGRLTISISISFDTWYYMGILPANRTTSSIRTSAIISAFRYVRNIFLPNKEQVRTITYKYSFRTQSCLEWKGENWISKSCKLGEKTTAIRLHCKCKSLATVAGMTYAPASKVDDTSEIEYGMKVIYTYHIFLTMGSILLCYFLAMCFAMFRTGMKRKEVYFLSDNVKEDRYAYLIIVKTGSSNYTGTSSNVVIKLYGNKSKSKAHVLNYPDPNRKLLQKSNEDWFILATAGHLGELVRLKLWFDSIGNRPTWYCDYIRICDLQLQKWWVFNMRRWFTVAEKDKHYYVIDIEEEILRQSKMDKQNFLKYFQFYFGPDHTWNLLSSSDDSHFTYLERITVVLSRILSTYCWGLLICVTPEMRLRDGFDKSFLSLYSHIFGYAVLISILSFGTNIVFVFFFRNSGRRPVSMIKRKALLPGYTIDVIWVILILCIVFEIFYLCAFGFWGSTYAWQIWLVMTTIAICISIFIWENMYLSVYTTIQKQLLKNIDTILTYDCKAIIRETEAQRKALYEVTGAYGLRPYLTHLYKPLSGQTVQRKKQIVLQRTTLSENVREMVLFMIYLVCVFWLGYESTDNMAVLHNKHLRNMIEAKNAKMPLGNIASLEDVYDYINNTFIPVIFSANWYGNWNVIDPGLMADFSTKVLGAIRVRQKRVKKNSCALNYFGKMLNFTECNPELSKDSSDKMSYGGIFSMWTYKNPLQAGITVTYGVVSDYGGGGYVTILGRHINNAYYMTELLKKNNWINSSTRGLFIEFWTYNANRNLFNAVKIVIERSATQFIHTSPEVYTGQLMHMDIRAEMVAIIVSSIFALIVFCHTFKYVSAIIKQKLRFFKKFWNIIDTIIIVMNYAFITMTLYQIQLVDDLLNQLESTKKTDFVNYYSAIYYHKVVTLVSAFLICIATLGVWKYLRFGVVFRVFERTLIKQIVPMTGVLVFNVVALLMFSLAGYLLFKSFSRNFRDLFTTFTSLILLALNITEEDFDFEILKNYTGYGGLVYYAIFVVVMLFVTKTYITVIIMSYEDSVEYCVDEGLSYSVMDYARDELQYLGRYFTRYLRSFRLKGGAGLESKVNPKFHKYSDAFVVTEETLNKMSVIAMGVAHNFLFRQDKSSLDASDIRMMIRIVCLTMNPPQTERKQMFFKGEREKEVRLVADDRLLEMERILKILLKEGKIEEKKEPYSTDETTLQHLNDIQKFVNTINCVIGNINIVTIKRKKYIF